MTHAPAPPIRNALLIGVDQMRADVIGPSKAVPAPTPHLDALMARSVRFERAYATCPLCSPARASMLTGDYAFAHGMGTNCDMYHSLAAELPDPSRLLHHDLLAAGWRCGFVGKWHVGAESGPADFGFEGLSLPGYGNVTASAPFRNYLERHELSYEVEPTIFLNPDCQTMLAGRWRGPAASTPAAFLTEETIGLLEGFGADPFLATIQYWDPHAPHLVADEFDGITERSLLRPWASFADDLAGAPRRVSRERDDFYRLHPRTEAEVIEYIGAYCDHMAMLDAQIGRLLDWLEQSGRARDTLVVLTSDHGDMTGAHGGLVDKGLLYEEAIRVPLAFAHPSLAPGARDALALNMDILPTAMDLLGVAHGPRQAASLAPLLADPDAPRRPHALVEYHGLRFLYSQRALIGDDGWKYVFTPGDEDELYDLGADPDEMRNLAADPDHAERLAAMRAATMAETARLNDPLRDTVAKFNGIWRTGSGQFDATSAYLTKA